VDRSNHSKTRKRNKTNKNIKKIFGLVWFGLVWFFLWSLIIGLCFVAAPPTPQNKKLTEFQASISQGGGRICKDAFVEAKRF
jgi:hypothetical protein